MPASRPYCLTLSEKPYLLRDSGQRELALSAGEFTLLRTLYANPARPVAWEELIRALGKEPGAYDHKQVQSLVSFLKRKALKQRIWLGIRPVRGVGYELEPDGPRECA